MNATLGFTDAVVFGWFAGPHKDSVMERWPLMSSPVPMLSLIATYVVACSFKTKIAPKVPLALPTSLVVGYNAFLVALSAYMGFGLLFESFRLGHHSPCNPYDYSENTTRLRWYIWCFYFSKFIEFGDTALMIVRRKFEQVSFLHVYHHATMPLLWYLAGGWIAPGDSWLGPMVNSFVHTLMYSYYALSAIDYPVPWKRYLTQLQLTQFVGVLCYDVYIAVSGPRCCIGVTDPTLCSRMHWLCASYMVSLFALFSDFYFRSYGRGKAHTHAQQKKEQ